MLAQEVSAGWSELTSFLTQTQISLSTPVLGTIRAIESSHELNKQPLLRATRANGARYVLRTDIARFYPSIYTHSIPWALHGEDRSRSDSDFGLLGNRLDLFLRETQDKQTGGIPIGPDTSTLIGEIIGTAMDVRLKAAVPNLRGCRSVDDFYLYFNTLSEAEACLAKLHSITRQFELEINDPKTEISQMPAALEPSWKSDLRAFRIRSQGQAQTTDLMSLFDRAIHHSRIFTSHNVMTYIKKQILGAEITEENWPFCESLLLQSAISEPTMLSVLTEIYDRSAEYHHDSRPLSDALHAICAYHAPLQQGNEVSWALWLAKKHCIVREEPIADLIAEMDDDIVALLSLDLLEQGRFKTLACRSWQERPVSTDLYGPHWLFAYEAYEHGWIQGGSRDYVAGDAFFSILRNNNVRFYDFMESPTTSHFDYRGLEEGEEEGEEWPDDEDPSNYVDLSS